MAERVEDAKKSTAAGKNTRAYGFAGNFKSPSAPPAMCVSPVFCSMIKEGRGPIQIGNGD
ncbi:hypothetical protein JI735_07195 [Paenibacillus sonchi]|uniref:Uncharacterized protein n=1 Tax=Paenibacillus sonchi TaxID=373687 RepID=A0A974SEE5_9BACL|nr:hypothetical protein [Paenibacillus sonchi]QQZ62379.1 hypothetical protein JI735_07195 [Paenibacillus sonchi]